MLYSRQFNSARAIISADKVWRLRAPNTPSARPGVYTHASYRRDNRARWTGRSSRSRGQERGSEGDEDGDGAETRTGVEANEGVHGGHGDKNGDGVGTRKRTGVETRRRTQDGNEDGSGNGNESSSGDGNGDKDGNGKGKEGGVREGGRKTKKRKKPHERCRPDVGNGGDLGGKRKNVDKKGLVQ